MLLTVESFATGEQVFGCKEELIQREKYWKDETDLSTRLRKLRINAENRELEFYNYGPTPGLFQIIYQDETLLIANQKPHCNSSGCFQRLAGFEKDHQRFYFTFHKIQDVNTPDGLHDITYRQRYSCVRFDSDQW